MKEKFSGFAHSWLIAFFISAAAVSVYSWLAAVPLHTASVLFYLLLWTAAIAALDKLGRFPAVLAFAVAAFGLTLLVCDRQALYETFQQLTAKNAVSAASRHVDLAVLMAAAPLSAAVMYAFRKTAPRAVLSAGWIVFWIVAAFMELAVPKLAFVAMLPVLLFTLAQLLQDRESGRRFDSVSSGLMILFAVSVFIAVMPSPPHPYGWPLVKSIWSHVEKLYYNIETGLFFRSEGGDEFGLSFNGFSDSAGLGAGLGGSEPQSILARPKMNTNGSLFLTGNSWDTFTGRGWISTVDPDQGDLLGWNVDTAEHLYALWRYRQLEDARSVDAFVRENNVYLQYDNMNTRSLFTTRNSLLITAEEDRFPWQAKSNATLFDYRQRSGTEYRLYWLEENARSMPELISASEGYEYSQSSGVQWYDIFVDFRKDFVLSFDYSVDIENVLFKREALIRETYLSLPDDITDRVRELTEEITSGCDTDYDKLMAIASYLKSNYSYSTAPTPVPRYAPFVDYVLFESREGYCTWYATAATVMARLCGIPARFTQGYTVRLSSEKLAPITGEDSHAWCEGYVSGYGWVIVEGTPGFSASDAGWSYEEEEAREYSGGDYEDEEYEEEWEEEDFGPLPLVNMEEEEEPVTVITVSPKFIAVIVFFMLLGAVIAADMRWGRARRKYAAAGYSERAVADLQKLLKTLSRRGYTRRSDESLRKYFARIKWSSISIDTVNMNEMAVLYEEIIFNDRELTEEEWLEEKAFTDKLRKKRR